jgi:hypothetical protein
VPDCPRSGLVLGLAADQLTGLVDQNPVASWIEDAAGAVFANAVAAQQPTYSHSAPGGKPCVHFHGAQVLLGPAAILGQLALNVSWTASMVVRCTPLVTLPSGRNDVILTNYPSLASQQGWIVGDLISEPAPSSLAPGIFATIANDGVHAMAGEWNVDASLPAFGVWDLWTVTYDGSGVGAGFTLWRNGVPQHVQATVGSALNPLPTTNPTCVGHSADGGTLGGTAGIGLIGDVAELRLWTPALPDIIRQTGEGYLQQKWLAQPGGSVVSLYNPNPIPR